MASHACTTSALLRPTPVARPAISPTRQSVQPAGAGAMNGSSKVETSLRNMTATVPDVET